MPSSGRPQALPKWPFLLGDAVLVAAAWFIEDQAPHPLEMGTVLAIVGCAALAGIIGIIPFLADHARRQEESLDDRQHSLEALARTTAGAAEQISIAASGFQEIATLAQKNLKQAEQIPQALRDMIAESEAAARNRIEETRALIANLDERITRIRAARPASGHAAKAPPKEEPPRSEAAPPAEPAPAPEPESAAKPENGPPADPLPPADGLPKADGQPHPESAAPEAALPAKDSAETAPPPEPAPKPAPRKRAPRKPSPAPAPVEAASSTEAPKETNGDAPPEEKPEAPPKEEPALTLEYSQTAPDEAAPIPALSADGATRLLVTAYIGIGNRLFIRGEGPGLDWEKGQPLQFVSIGKWRWESADATAPVRFKLYKNDEVECAALGSCELEPGKQWDVSARF